MKGQLVQNRALGGCRPRGGRALSHADHYGDEKHHDARRSQKPHSGGSGSFRALRFLDFCVSRRPCLVFAALQFGP